MDNTFPQIEIMPNQEAFSRPEPPHIPWYKARRFIVFTLTFLLSAILSLSYLYSRPALYRSYATLLTVAQTAIDEISSKADIQHVAIQRQILTGQELLNETLTLLDQNQQQDINRESRVTLAQLTIAELRNMLTVEAVPDTNLVELAAQGYQAEILKPIINTWIEVYLQRRGDEIKQTTGLTIEILQEELSGLEKKVLIKRTELEIFRSNNNITSLGRENIFENQSLAKFRGLNQSLSVANEEAIKAKAKLDAINRAIEQGKVVVPSEDVRSMRFLERKLQKLQKKLTDFDEKYTRQYLELNPGLNVLPQQIKALELEIQKKRNIGKSIVLTEAEREYDAARQTLHETQLQLKEHNKEATAFSSKFSEHESLLSDLEGLEVLQRETQERLIQIEAKQAEKFPQVKVIERAFYPRDPISPNYTRDAIIAFVSSIILGLFGVWIVDYLTRKEIQTTTISVTGSNLYRDMAPGLISTYAQKQEQLNQNSSQSLQHDESHKLENDLHQELNVNEIDELLESSDIKAKQLISLLLSGLSLGEISRLTGVDFDFNNNSINISGEENRSIPLNPALKTLFEHIEPCPVWFRGESIAVKKLEAILIYASVDAGLAESQNITADSLSYSYILYLVKQGIRLSELVQVIGDVDPGMLSQYSRYSPEKKGLPLGEINLLYPALEKYVE